MTTPNAEDSSEALQRGNAPARILIADDDADGRAALAELLRAEGYDVDVAENGRVALERIGDRKRRPALVVLDLAMPEVTGWEVLDELATNRSTAQTAVMVLSGMENVASPRPRVRWLRKPIDPGDLLAAIRATLTRLD